MYLSHIFYMADVDMIRQFSKLIWDIAANQVL